MIRSHSHNAILVWSYIPSCNLSLILYFRRQPKKILYFAHIFIFFLHPIKISRCAHQYTVNYIEGYALSGGAVNFGSINTHDENPSIWYNLLAAPIDSWVLMETAPILTRRQNMVIWKPIFDVAKRIVSAHAVHAPVWFTYHSMQPSTVFLCPLYVDVLAFKGTTILWSLPALQRFV